MSAGRCAECKNPLPQGCSSRRKYCPPPAACKANHDKREWRRRKRRAELELLTGQVDGRVSPAESADGRASVRRGAGYEEWVAAGWPVRVRSGELSQREAQVASGASQANVSRWLAAWDEDQLVGARRRAWLESGAAQRVELMLHSSPESFAVFRSRYFTDEWGAPYETPEFHLRWIGALLDSIERGGRLQILSPPRHGKTQLLIHFCVWLVCRNPNLRIIWIGLNEDNAREALGAVKDILENDEQLSAELLGPGGSWKPPARAGLSWTDKIFTVGNRTLVGIKAPTMRAVGKGGKLLSKDADWIVGDDVQDQEAHNSPASREKDRHWVNTQVSSRKEAHTGLTLIGSRQDHEDLYGGLFSNPEWSSIVEHAHDPSCRIPLHPPREGHSAGCAECALHVGCLLWPSKRTMAYLQSQRVAMDDDLVFDMVYNNVTRPGGDVYVTQAQIDACKSNRVVGRWVDREVGSKVVALPAGRMIAGLDPASVGMQAAFLWVFNPQTKVRYAIDVDNRAGGSLMGAREIIRDWFELYGCQWWVIERNNFQLAILQDPDLKAYCNTHGITLEPHFTTAYNKFDANFGVPKQLEAFAARQIDIPWGDEETRGRFQPAVKQWVGWYPNSREKSDIPMAAWFPERHFLNWRREESSRAQFEYGHLGYVDGGLASTYQKVGA